MSDADFKSVILTLPYSDLIARWNELQTFANDSQLQINWDATRELLVISGTGLDESQLIDQVTSIVYPGNSAQEFTWNVNWKCSVGEKGFDYVLAIAADESEPLSALRMHKQVASQHIRDALPIWENLVLEHVYPLYVKNYSKGEPCRSHEFRSALKIKGEIVYSPNDKSYEVYFSANPYIDTHLINVFEEARVTYPPTLEWA